MTARNTDSSDSNPFCIFYPVQLENGNVIMVPGVPFDKNGGTKTSDWMVNISNIGLISTLNGVGGGGKNLTEHGQVYGWFCEQGINKTPNAINNLITGGLIWHSSVILILQSGPQDPTFMKYVCDGTITPLISLVRIVLTGQGPKIQQELTFKYCTWCKYSSLGDLIAVGFEPGYRQNKIIQRKHIDGSEAGNSVIETNYTENTVKVP
ncbi:MAG: hypothetical protein LBF72_00780 [Holosporales bacterium]|jgi:hypothetical protein|nr:hypothetical protein [Holosporales bacterium]